MNVDNRFPAQCRLKNRQDILAVYARRDIYRGERLVFYRGDASKSNIDQPPGRPEPESRFCLAVSKHCGGAVRRNRIKRVLREIIRKNKYKIASGYDFVIRVNAARLRENVTEKDFLDDFADYFGWN